MLRRTKSIRLVLFFTRDVSLQTWDNVGMFDREVALYERLRDKGVCVSFVTYGNADDLDYRERLPRIEILCNRWGLPNRFYEKFLHRLHGISQKSCDLIKTNQMSGADTALRAAKMWNKPLIARCGYMFSYNVGRQYGFGSSNTWKARKLEKNVFQAADRIIVTTNQMLKQIEELSSEFGEKTNVLPNYVDTEKFFPTKTNKDFDILVIGRLANEKNIASLLEAVRELKCRIVIIGKGPLEKELKKKYGNMDNCLDWISQVPNNELPDYMNRSKIYVIPSHYEGHPKSLIEAMSCGMPVIGADSPGIREIIHHGKNGLLCGTDFESICQAIQRLLNDPSLAKKIGKRARKFVLKNCTLEDLVEKELKIIKEVAALKI